MTSGAETTSGDAWEMLKKQILVCETREEMGIPLGGRRACATRAWDCFVPSGRWGFFKPPR